ncbi:MAG: oligosaccharyl transferase glycoprotein complex, beta subunit [Candelina submexicana]|nr:MAG: oligosaccharyl transferase glycoprotein complex, beta subunit [Candelina submexicana]
MRWLFSVGLLALTLLAAWVQALSTSGTRLLVVLDDSTEKGSYSKFWEDLEARGYKLSFESPKNEKLSLFQHGARAYDHLILFPPRSKGLGPALTPKLLLQFLNNAGNILLTLSSNSPTPSAISSLLLELGINLPSDRTSLVVDHFNYDTVSAPEKHDVVLLPRPGPLRPDVKNYFGGRDTDVIAFPRGVGQVLENTSPHLAPVLRAPNTAYAYNPKDEAGAVEDPFAVGQQLNLVSTMQARNSARFTVLGSMEMLEDTWFNAKVKSSSREAKQTTTANRAFAAEISAWTFMETGVLKVDKIEHSLRSIEPGEKPGNDSLARLGDLNPKIYRVKNDVIFTISISEYSLTHYVPLTLPASDTLQLEFSMLSPFHRLPLHPTQTTQNSTIFTTTFTLPDQHGIFNFRVNYKRPFLTNIDEKRTVTVRHFAHDEWPRSWKISGGWPWIAGVGVTIAGWVGFVGVWLWSEPAFEKGKGKKRQ